MVGNGTLNICEACVAEGADIIAARKVDAQIR
jgi:hypothetical protein